MLIVSLKYSPVYSAHMYAIYCAGNDLGINIIILCNSKYHSDLIQKGVKESSIYSYEPPSRKVLDEIFTKNWRKPLKQIAENNLMDCIVMNPHPANPLFFADYSKIVGGKRFLWLHEPHKTFSELFQYGASKGVYFFIAMLIARWSVTRVEHCLLPSKYALNRFQKYYPFMVNKSSLLPLMFPNLSTQVKEKHYFSFVGHVNKGKGIEPFLQLVEYCHKNNLKYQFQIISSTLSQPWLSQAQKMEGTNLKIISKDNISDLEIAQSIASSYAILCLYLTVTQSSIVANAMMQGTPVIASKIGSLPEVITNGETGYLVQNPYDHGANIKFLELCIERADNHKNYCLEEFQKSYSIDTVKPHLLQIYSLEK